jgi:hypothetical protein
MVVNGVVSEPATDALDAGADPTTSRLDISYATSRSQPGTMPTDHGSSRQLAALPTTSSPTRPCRSGASTGAMAPITFGIVPLAGPSPGELDPEPARASEAATDPLRAVADGGGESGLDAQVVGGSPSAVRTLVGILVPAHPPLGERWDATPGRRTASRNACIGAIEEPGGGGDRRAGDRGEVGGRGGRDAAGAWSARGPMRRSTPCADRWDGSIRCASRRRAPGSAPAPRAVAGARAAGPRGVRSGRRTRPASRAPGAGAGSLRQDRPSGPGGLPGTVRTKVHRSPAARRPPPTQRRRVREGPARCRRRAIRPAFRGPGRPAPAPGPGWPRRARR